MTERCLVGVEVWNDGSRSFAYHPQTLPQRANIALLEPHEENVRGPCAQDDSLLLVSEEYKKRILRLPPPSLRKRLGPRALRMTGLASLRSNSKCDLCGRADSTDFHGDALGSCKLRGGLSRLNL